MHALIHSMGLRPWLFLFNHMAVMQWGKKYGIPALDQLSFNGMQKHKSLPRHMPLNLFTPYTWLPPIVVPFINRLQSRCTNKQALIR
jgi:hypothetical protein